MPRFDDSRHAELDTYTRTVGPDGTDVELYEPRPLAEVAVARHHTVGAMERLDHIAAEAFDRPHDFWRLVEANPVDVPEALLVPGSRIAIPESD